MLVLRKKADEAFFFFIFFCFQFSSRNAQVQKFFLSYFHPVQIRFSSNNKYSIEI